MNLLHLHDSIRINYLFYFDNFHFFFINKWIRPLLIEDDLYGSDPITHKRIREKTPNPPENNTSTSASNSSTTVKTQTDKTDLSDEQMKSSVKRQKLN